VATRRLPVDRKAAPTGQMARREAHGGLTASLPTNALDAPERNVGGQRTTKNLTTADVAQNLHRSGFRFLAASTRLSTSTAETSSESQSRNIVSTVGRCRKINNLE